MPDNLQWMNEHPVLFLHPLVEETVLEENYKLSTPLAELASRYRQSDDFLKALRDKGNYKEACNFLCYNLHHRAAVWWAYLCVLDLNEELQLCPHKPRDIADIAKPRPLNVPEWAKAPKPKDDTPQVNEQLSQLQDAMTQIKDLAAKIIPPDVQEKVDGYISEFENIFKQQHGFTPKELMQKAIEKLKVEETLDPEFTPSPDSPIFKAAAELKEKIEKQRQQTVDLIKKALGEPDVVLINKQRRSCLDAVYAYIAAPNAKNASALLELGNQCPQTPEGLLALAGFWSFGDLAPNLEQVVNTPPGLMANGISSLLLQCALKQGGNKSFDLRYETYFNLGFDVVTGKNTWSKAVEEGKSPHAKLQQKLQEEQRRKDLMADGLTDHGRFNQMPKDAEDD